jgi:HD-like signal output (HDOD) protein
MEREQDPEQAAKRTATMERIVQQIDTLPPMPETAMKLRALANDPNVDFPQIVPYIERDPGLCADLLRFANSVATGVGHPVETVREAVRYYGMDNLLHYIWASYANRMIRESFKALRHLDDYFVHAEQVSTACTLLACRANLAFHDQEVCKVVGLLHNVGKLVVLFATRQWNEPLCGTPWEERAARIAEEKEAYGLNHCEVGARLCEKWNFPPKLLEGIRYHHQPVRNGELLTLAAYVYVGELLVIDDLPTEAIVGDFTPVQMKILNLSESAIRQTREEFLGMRADIQSAYGRRRPGARNA